MESEQCAKDYRHLGITGAAGSGDSQPEGLTSGLVRECLTGLCAGDVYRECDSEGLPESLRSPADLLDTGAASEHFPGYACSKFVIECAANELTWLILVLFPDLRPYSLTCVLIDAGGLSGAVQGMRKSMEDHHVAARPLLQSKDGSHVCM